MFVCLLLQDLVQSCLLVCGRDIGGHVLRETTSRGQCELVCPSRTNERGGEGYCVKGEGKKKGSARGSVQGGCDYTTALDIEVDPRFLNVCVYYCSNYYKAEQCVCVYYCSTYYKAVR